MAPPINVGAATVGGGSQLTLATGTLTGSSTASARKNDLITAVIGYQTTSGGKPATPAGWSEVGYRAQGVQKLHVFARIAAADGAVSISFGAGDISQTLGNSQSIHAWRSAAGGTLIIAAAGDAVDSASGLTLSASIALGAALLLDDVVFVSVLSTHTMVVSLTGYGVTAGATFAALQGRIRGSDAPLTPISAGGVLGCLLGTQHSVTVGGAGTLTVVGSWSTNNCVQTLVGFVIREIEPLVFPRAPVIALVSPAEGPTTSTTDIVVDVTDPDNDLVRVEPRFNFPVIGVPELAHDWDGPAFIGPYIAASSRTPITNGFRYTFDRGGWVDTAMSLQVVATDAGGRITTSTFAWTTDFGGSYSCSIEGDPPVIALTSPAEGAILSNAELVVTATDADDDIVQVLSYITFDNLDLTENVGNWITTLPPGSPPELQTFYEPYFASSVRTGITNGWRLNINRTGGWIDTNMTLWVIAIDSEGHVTVESFSWTVAAPAAIPTSNPPVVTLVSPPNLSTISRTQHLHFLVTDIDAPPQEGGGLERALPQLIFPDTSPVRFCLIHTGDDFTPEFQGSSREPYDGPEGKGYSYDVIWWSGSWPTRPKLLPFAYDMTGQEAA